MLWQPENFHIGEQSLQQDWSCSNGWTDAWNNKIIDGTNVISNVLCLLWLSFSLTSIVIAHPPLITHTKGGHFVSDSFIYDFPSCLRIERPICRADGEIWMDVIFWRADWLCVAVLPFIYLCMCCTVIRRVSERLVMRLGISDFTVAHLSSTTVHYSLQGKLESHIPLLSPLFMVRLYKTAIWTSSLIQRAASVGANGAAFADVHMMESLTLFWFTGTAVNVDIFRGPNMYAICQVLCVVCLSLINWASLPLESDPR